MFRKYPLQAVLLALACSTSPVNAHELGAHVHGIATLQVAVDRGNLTLEFSSPLDNLVGFEHYPHNAAQKTAIRKLSDTLNHADHLFIPTAAAQCSLQSVKLDSPVLKPEDQSAHANGERAHADLDGEFVFTCMQSDKLHDLDVKLFGDYPNLHRLKVEIVSMTKQAATTLTAKHTQANW